MKVSLGIFILLILFFVGPILAIYDVVVNERTLSLFGLLGMSMTFRAVHMFYMLASLFVLVILAIGVMAFTPSLLVIIGRPSTSNKQSDKYHRPSCSVVKTIKPTNRIYFESIREAKARGYTAC